MYRFVLACLFICLGGCASLLVGQKSDAHQISEEDIVVYAYQNSENKGRFIDHLTNTLIKNIDFSDDKFLGRKDGEIYKILSSTLRGYFESLPILILAESSSDGGVRYTRYYGSRVNISSAEYDHNRQELLIRHKPVKRLSIKLARDKMISEEWPLKTQISVNDIYQNIDSEIDLGSKKLAWSVSPEKALRVVKRANDPNKLIERKKKLAVVQGESPFYTYHWDKRDVKQQVKSLDCSITQQYRLLIVCSAQTSLDGVSIARDG